MPSPRRGSAPFGVGSCKKNPVPKPAKTEEKARALAPKPRCRCGYDRDHHFVSPEPKHTFWGWVLMTLGITSIPVKMGFRCRRCNTLIEETTDPAVIKRYRG